MGNRADGAQMNGTGKPHVAVLMGGWANEREVSLMSGKGVADALESRGYRVTRIDMDRSVAARISEASPDVVFKALHGVPGDAGTVQGMPDLMGDRKSAGNGKSGDVRVDLGGRRTIKKKHHTKQ